MAMKLATDAVKMRFPRVRNISTDELDQLMKTNSSEQRLMLLDVRNEKEFQVSHLLGALHVSPSSKDLEEVIRMIAETVAPSAKLKVVCYCSVGYRSSALAQQLSYELHKPGHEDLKSSLELYNLEGSIFKWANEGRELVDNKGNKTVFVHPYNIVWGKLLNYELRCSGPNNRADHNEQKETHEYSPATHQSKLCKM